MPKAGTHAENRFKICLLCFGKSKVMVKIDRKLKDLVMNNVEYDCSDERLPAAVCINCKKNLYQIKKNSENKAKLPIFSDLESLRKMNTRLSSKSLCDCYICQLVRSSVPTNFRSSESQNIVQEKGLSKLTNKKVLGKYCIIIFINSLFPFIYAYFRVYK